MADYTDNPQITIRTHAISKLHGAIDSYRNAAI